MQYKRILPAAVLSVAAALSGETQAGWRLLWADELNYTGPPKAANWTLAEWPPGRVNHELQAYTSRPEIDASVTAGPGLR